MSSPRTAAQKQTTEAFIEAWKRLAVDDIAELRAEDCLQFSLPSDSLKMLGMTSKDFVAQLGPMFAQLSNFKVSEISSTHDGEAGKSVLHAKTAADSPIGPYRNEHIFIFTFTEDGTKMTKIEDMMDSAFIMDFGARMQEFAKKQASK